MKAWVLLAMVGGMMEVGCADQDSPLNAKVRVLDGWPAATESGPEEPVGPQGQPVEGQLRRVSVTLQNRSEGPVVLVNVQTDRSLERGYSWQKSQYGALDWDEEAQAFHYDSLSQMATPSLFNGGLLWPGQEATAEMAVRFTEPRKTFLVTCYALNLEELSVWFYPPAAQSQEATEMGAYFKKRSPEELSQEQPRDGLFLVTAGGYDPLLADPSGSEPVRMFGWERPGEPPKPQQLTCAETFSLRSREKLLARGPAPKAPTVVGFCDTLGGWIVKGPKGALRFTDGRKSFRLPQVDPLVWDLIDAGPGPYPVQVDKHQPEEAESPTPEKRLASQADYGDLFPPYAGDGMYTRGIFVEVPRDKLVPFLQRAYRKKHTVGVNFYFFDSWHLTSLPGAASD